MSYYFFKGAFDVGDHEVRYFVIPMIIVFILGIASINEPAFPVFSFMIVGLVSILVGTVFGWLAFGIKILFKFFHTWKEHRDVKKVVSVSKR